MMRNLKFTVKLTMGLLLCAVAISTSAQSAERTQRTVQMFHPVGPEKFLTKEEAILLALRNNPQVRAAGLQRVLDKFTLEVARNEFEPHYTLKAFSSIDEHGEVTVDGGPGVSLKTPFGAELSIDTDTTVYGEQSGELTVKAKIPLMRGFGTDVNLAAFRNAKDAECANRLTFKEQLQTTITQVISAYHTLVQDYNSLAVDRASLKDSMDSLKAARLQIKAGNRAETSITQTEAQVARQQFQITRASNTVNQDTQKLLILLGLNPHCKITVDKTIDISHVKVPSEQEAIQLALKKNIPYLKNLISLRALERNLFVAQDEQRWDLSLNAQNRQNYFLQDDPEYNDRRASLELNIPIDDKPRQMKLMSAKISLDKFKIDLAKNEQQLISDVITALADIKAQKEQIHLAEQSVKYTEQSFRIAQKKLQHGRSTEFEVTTLLTQLNSEQQTVISQKITFLNTIAQFEQTLGVSLDRWHITLFC